MKSSWSNNGEATVPECELIAPGHAEEEWYLISDSVITADWNTPSSERWVVPLGGGFGKTFNIGKQAVNTNIQAYWNAADTEVGPDWTLVFTFQLLFPK